MVKALQARGHTVAMTGDGVNDVLALKLADIGVAMGSGAAATKAVAELVLLDNGFATLPGVVAEGRRVTANIERVANLFVTKTVWATLLAVAAGAALIPYPFLPRHLTIIDTLAIGVPAFFLALAPNRRRYVPGFVGRVLRFTVPAGLIVAAATFSAYALARARGLPLTRAAHGRDPGHAHPQPVRARPAGDAADLAQDRAARRRARRIRAAVPRARRAHVLRARAAARRDRQHAAHRRTGSRRAHRLLGPLPSARPRTGPGGRK